MKKSRAKPYRSRRAARRRSSGNGPGARPGDPVAVAVQDPARSAVTQQRYSTQRAASRRSGHNGSGARRRGSGPRNASKGRESNRPTEAELPASCLAGRATAVRPRWIEHTSRRPVAATTIGRKNGTSVRSHERLLDVCNAIIRIRRRHGHRSGRRPGPPSGYAGL
jgi:hypothetical protein